MEHIKGIHRIPGVRGASAYLLTEGPITLVDSGLPGSGRAVIDFMAALGLRPEALERILLTHRHPDHCGGAAHLRALTGARVFAHAGDVTLEPAGPVLRGLTTEAVAIDQVLHGGEVLEPGIEVIHCGGHTAGSACFYLRPARALFLGDMAINNIDRLSRPISFSIEDKDAYEASLEALTRVDAAAGFFGHGPPLLEGLQEALIALKARKPTPAWLAPLRYALLRLRHPFRRD